MDSEDFRDRTYEFRSLVKTLKPSDPTKSFILIPENCPVTPFQTTYQIIMADIEKIDVLKIKLNNIISTPKSTTSSEIIDRQIKTLRSKLEKSQKNIIQLKKFHTAPPKTMIYRYNQSIISILETSLRKYQKEIKKDLEDYQRNLVETTQRQRKLSNTTAMETEMLSMAHDETETNMNDFQNQQQIFSRMQQQNQVDINQRDEVEALRNMQETVAMISQYTQELNQLVLEQGEAIIRIDDVVEQANVNLVNTRHELRRYLERLARDRCFVFKLIGIFSFFLFLYLFFFN